MYFAVELIDASYFCFEPIFNVLPHRLWLQEHYSCACLYKLRDQRKLCISGIFQHIDFNQEYTLNNFLSLNNVFLGN